MARHAKIGDARASDRFPTPGTHVNYVVVTAIIQWWHSSRMSVKWAGLSPQPRRCWSNHPVQDHRHTIGAQCVTGSAASNSSMLHGPWESAGSSLVRQQRIKMGRERTRSISIPAADPRPCVQSVPEFATADGDAGTHVEARTVLATTCTTNLLNLVKLYRY